MVEKIKYLQLVLSEDTHKKLKRLSIASNKTMQELGIIALNKLLESY